MRKTIFTIVASTLMFGGAACKKDNSETTDKPGMEVRKAQEEVKDQKEDVAGEAKDVTEQVKDFQEENKELANEAVDVKVAEADLAAARVTYTAAVGQRLAKLDAKIAELDAKGGAEARTLASELRVRRNALGSKLGHLAEQTDMAWSGYTRAIDREFDSIEHDLFDALD